MYWEMLSPPLQMMDALPFIFINGLILRSQIGLRRSSVTWVMIHVHSLPQKPSVQPVEASRSTGRLVGASTHVEGVGGGAVKYGEHEGGTNTW